MADQRDSVNIHFVVKKVSRFRVPVAPLRQVLKQQPAARVILLLQSRPVFKNIDPRRDRRIDKIFVDRSEYDAAARQQFAKVAVAGIGKVLHRMIAMYDEDQRKRSVTLRVPDARL